MTSFLIKSPIILSVLFLHCYDICGYQKMVGQKKIFSPSSSGAVVGSGTRDPGWIKSGSGINILDAQHWKNLYILLDTEAEVCNGAGEVPLDEDVPGLEVAVRYCRLPLNRK
jgi:hypothetical protein